MGLYLTLWKYLCPRLDNILKIVVILRSYTYNLLCFTAIEAESKGYKNLIMIKLL